MKREVSSSRLALAEKSNVHFPFEFWGTGGPTMEFLLNKDSYNGEVKEHQRNCRIQTIRNVKGFKVLLSTARGRRRRGIGVGAEIGGFGRLWGAKAEPKRREAGREKRNRITKLLRAKSPTTGSDQEGFSVAHEASCKHATAARSKQRSRTTGPWPLQRPKGVAEPASRERGRRPPGVCK